MKKLLLLLLCVPLIGFGQIEEAANIEVDKDGYVKKYYENGQLEVEGNRKDGKREGLWKWYYENGQLAIEGNWKDGSREGLWKWYYGNGQLELEGNYGTDGWNGLWKWYYEDGQLARQERWRTSRKTPIHKRCWDEEGNKIECK